MVFELKEGDVRIVCSKERAFSSLGFLTEVWETASVAPYIQHVASVVRWWLQLGPIVTHFRLAHVLHYTHKQKE